MRSQSRDSTSRFSMGTYSSLSRQREISSMKGPRPLPLTKSRRTSSQPHLPTVKDFVSFVAKTDQVWGFKGYHIPKWNAGIENQIKFSVPKEKGKRFINAIEKRAKFGPAPDTYKAAIKWDKTILGTMKGEDRTTFIRKIFKTEGSKPSPSQYNIDDYQAKKMFISGKMAKGTRQDTTWEAEYLASVTPSAKYIDIYTKVQKSGSMPDLKKGLTWKVKKKDGPDPGSYPNKEKAFHNYARRVSPSWKLGKSQRNFFTKVISKKKEWVPGSGKYNTIDFDKVHRRLTSRRH